MADATVDQLLRDLQAVVADAERLLKATAGETSERVRDMRAKAEAALGEARERLSGVEDEFAERAKTAVRETDEYVHDHPWLAVGAAAGLGFVVGLLTARR